MPTRAFCVGDSDVHPVILWGCAIDASERRVVALRTRARIVDSSRAALLSTLKPDTSVPRSERYIL